MRSGCYEYVQKCKLAGCKKTFHCCSGCGLAPGLEPQVAGYCCQEHYDVRPRPPFARDPIGEKE